MDVIVSLGNLDNVMCLIPLLKCLLYSICHYFYDYKCIFIYYLWSFGWTKQYHLGL